VEFTNTTRLFGQLLRRYRDFDLVHCFGRTLYLTPLLLLKIPKIQTYMCPLNLRKLRIARALAGDSLTFVACSQSVAKAGNGIGRWVVIPNGISLRPYEYNPLSNGKEDYLVFLSRLHRIKGVHTAIRVARAVGKRLIIAGNIAPSGPDLEYFRNEIKPQIDGRQIKYIGTVDDRQKNTLLGEAEALLFPIEWEEPMAVVVLEALACGLPVIAFNRGSIQEVLTHGKDGFICSSEVEMIAAVKRLREINRAECRKTVETRFSSDVIVGQHERLYSDLLKC